MIPGRRRPTGAVTARAGRIVVPMTATTSHTGPRDDDGAPYDTERVSVSGPGGLVAALPGLLGFVPEDSMVLVLLGGETRKDMVAALRQDLSALLAHPAALVDVVRRLRVMRETEEFDVLVVLVDGEWDGDEPEACHELLVDALLDGLDGSPIEIAGAVVASAVRADAPWAEVGCGGRRGTVPDPGASALTAAHVLRGRTVHGSRAEIEALLEQDGPAERDALFDQIGRCAGAVFTRRQFGGDEALRDEFAAVVAAVETVARGDDPLPEQAARVALALGCTPVRDAAMGLTMGERAAAACRLWALLARRLDGVLRAEASALFAFGAYAKGDGTVAGVGVDAALDARPGHVLASLLDEALQVGIHPARVREIGRYAVESASADGFVIPWLRGGAAPTGEDEGDDGWDDDWEDDWDEDWEDGQGGAGGADPAAGRPVRGGRDG